MLHTSRSLMCATLSLLTACVITACTTPFALPTAIVIPSQPPLNTLQPTVTAAIAIVAQSSTPEPSLTTVPTLTPTIGGTASPIPTETVIPTDVVMMAPPTTDLTVAPIITTEPTTLSTSEPDAVVTSAEGLNLRSGPGTQYEPPLVLLEPNTPLKILGQSPDFLWYKVETFTGQQGWAYSKLLTVYQEPPNLPIVEAPTQTSMIVIDSHGAQPLGAPAFANVVTDRMRQVYQLGQQMGNNPRVFIKVGDSVTDQQAFMVGFGTGEYNLGPYTSLQASIDYFSRDAFARDSLSAEPAFNSGSVMDSFRVPDEGKDVCQVQEKPLECEIRVMKPAFAVILFGGNEVRSMDIDSFTNQMQQLIDLTTSRGVIPIFNTFPHSSNFHENAPAFNDALRAMAADNQIPIIDLEVAVRPLPNEGVEQEDGFHLSMLGIRTDPINRIDLNGDEKQYGAVLRDLLTLQMLDSLRIGLGLN